MSNSFQLLCLGSSYPALLQDCLCSLQDPERSSIYTLGLQALRRQQISASLEVEEMTREELECRSTRTRKPLNRENIGEMSGSKGFAEINRKNGN